MTIGLLEKKLQGGGVKITPPLPYYFIGNSPNEEGLNRDAKFITDQLALQVLQKYKKGHHIMFSVSLGSFKEVKKRPFMLIETHFSIFGAGAVSRSLALCLFSAS